MRVWIAFALLVLIIIGVNVATGALSNCPATTYGTSEKTIKYFSSPLCVACWVQKPIVEKIAAEGKVTFEEYNIDFCRDAAAPHYIRGIPSFIVNSTVVYGLQTEEQLRELTA